MRKAPVFIANSEDGMHCVNAVFRMIAKELLNKDFTWEEIDLLTRAEGIKATWTFVGETEFAKMGLKVKNIEPIDYERLHKEGVNYLQETMSSDVFNYTIEKSNISSVLQYIPEFIKHVEHETRRATVDEIVSYLKEGKLIAAEVNSRILNNLAGHSLHFVLLYDFDGENIILHDPGLPPVEARKVSLADFDRCFNYPGANGEVTVFWK